MTITKGDWVTGTIADGATATGEIDLGMECDFVTVRIPALTSCTLKIQVAKDKGGTFLDVGDGLTTRTTTGSFTSRFRLPSSTRYIKIVSSVAQAGGDDIDCKGGRY